MMRYLIYFTAILGIGIFLQLSMVSRIMLINGNADLILVLICGWSIQERVKYSWVISLIAGILVGIISATPWFIYLFSYLSVVAMARLVSHLIWQAPLLGMFSVTFLGTLIQAVLTYAFRFLFEGLSLSLLDVFNKVVLPSSLLNLLLAIGILPLMGQFANRLFPEEII